MVCFSGFARKTNHPLLSLCERSEYKERLILRKNLMARIADILTLRVIKKDLKYLLL
ncbi:MAG: hypothetical protein U5L45_16975 [Saprospiraceae bacterium]|nr:hypothetical protein [Saprospiraceae bacterium]